MINFRILILNMTIAFKILAPKYPNKAVFIGNLGIFFFHEILQFDMLTSNMTIFFKFQSKKTKIRHFWF